MESSTKQERDTRRGSTTQDTTDKERESKESKEKNKAEQKVTWSVLLCFLLFFSSRFSIDRLHRHRGQRDSLSLCPLGCFGLRFSFVCWSPFY